MTALAHSTRVSSRLARTLLGCAISAAALWVAISLVDVRASARHLSAADPMPLVLVLLVIAVQVVLRSWRWRVLLEAAVPGVRLSTARLVPVLLVGYLGNAVLPARAGEVVRSCVVARREPVGVTDALGTVLLERVLDVATLAPLAFVAAVLSGAPATLTQLLGVVAVGGMGILVALVAGAGLAARVVDALARLARRPIIESGLRLLRRIVLAARGGTPATVGLAVALSAAGWLLDAATFWLVGRSLGVPLAPSTALLVGAVTVIGTAVPSTPGYLGTFELAAVSTAVALGVDPSSALALAVLAHVFAVLPTAIGGAAALALPDITLRGAVPAVNAAPRDEIAAS